MSQNAAEIARPRAGYTLPVFACASAIAALQHLVRASELTDASGFIRGQGERQVGLNLVNPDRFVEVPVEQVALLPDGSALAVTRSDPGDNLDLTRHTPIWAVVAWGDSTQTAPIQIAGGEGIGRQVALENQAAIYRYARTLLMENLRPLLPENRCLRVTIILPEGRALAVRTSNAAFGVVDGLSLLGTSGISEPLSAPGQLETFREVVRQKAKQFDTLVFCVGENGLDLALHLGIPAEQRVKTANWLGPLLVEAALGDVKAVLLLGYHGKLIKLAGGIFHTHHHVADGRQEILAAVAASQGLPTADVQHLLTAETVETGLQHLRQLDRIKQTQWLEQVYDALVAAIDRRTVAYIKAHTGCAIAVGSAVFCRQREIIAVSPWGHTLLQSF